MRLLGKITIGVLVVAGVAVGAVIFNKKPKKVAKKESKAIGVKLDTKKLHKYELEKYLATLTIEDADNFMSYHNRLDDMVFKFTEESVYDEIMQHITWMLHMKNIEEYVMLEKATELFPEMTIEKLTTMPELARRMCQSMATGIGECLMTEYVTEDMVQVN